jgi:hypothetical protein
MSENVLRDKKMHSDLLPTERFGLPQSLDRVLWQPSLPATARAPSEKSSSWTGRRLFMVGLMSR